MAVYSLQKQTKQRNTRSALPNSIIKEIYNLLDLTFTDSTCASVDKYDESLVGGRDWEFVMWLEFSGHAGYSQSSGPVEHLELECSGGQEIVCHRVEFDLVFFCFETI